MNVKVQCPCGTRYAFEVEPVHGRMPTPVNCPSCGADGTALANTFIQEQLAAASPAPQPDAPTAEPAPPRNLHIRLHKPQAQSAQPDVPAIAPTMPNNLQLRLHRPEAPAAPSEPPANAPEVQVCAKHSKEPAVETCRVCGKPMCQHCMEMFGYVCSVYCRNQAERQKMDIPVYKLQRSVVEQRSHRRAVWLFGSCAALVAALAGAWAWYIFSGSHPRIVYDQKLSSGDRADFYELLAPHDVLSLHNGQMALYDVARHAQLWSTSAAPSAGSSDDSSSLPSQVVVTADDIWLLFPDHIAQYDRKTGSRKQIIPLAKSVVCLTHNDNSIVAISERGPARKTILRIALPAGTAQTEQVGPAEGNASETGPAAKQLSAAGTVERGMAAASTMAASGASTGAVVAPSDDEFFADGAGAIQFGVRLLERKFVKREAMKPKGKSYLNNNLTAADSMEASQEVMNDMRRNQTGGTVEVNVSRYQVTLRRLAAQDAPAWTGEVIGPPEFFPLQTVDVVAGGSSIAVFDKKCKRLWDAKLTYSLPTRSQDDSGDEPENPNPPCLEAGSTLYVFDQGMLNAFDLMTGQVRWRLTSVGISRVQADDRGNLYVDTTTASPDTLQFSQEINILNKIDPVLMKVDPATGKVLWKVEALANDCLLSGKYVYAIRSSTDAIAALNPSEPAQKYYNLYRLDPANGNVLWNYNHAHWPLQSGAQGNWILLHFPDEALVLKFLSL